MTRDDPRRRWIEVPKRQDWRCKVCRLQLSAGQADRALINNQGCPRCGGKLEQTIPPEPDRDLFKQYIDGHFVRGDRHDIGR